MSPGVPQGPNSVTLSFTRRRFEDPAQDKKLLNPPNYTHQAQLTWVVFSGFPAKLNQVEIPSITFDNLYKLLSWFLQSPGGAVRSSREPQLFLFDAGSFNMQCNFKKYMFKDVKRMACAEPGLRRSIKTRINRGEEQHSRLHLDFKSH